MVVEQKWQWNGGKGCWRGCTLDAIDRIRIRMGEEMGRLGYMHLAVHPIELK